MVDVSDFCWKCGHLKEKHITEEHECIGKDYSPNKVCECREFVSAVRLDDYDYLNQVVLAENKELRKDRAEAWRACETLKINLKQLEENARAADLECRRARHRGFLLDDEVEKLKAELSEEKQFWRFVDFLMQRGEKCPHCHGKPAERECVWCGVRDCPHNEPLHYHHDGCPACLKTAEARK